MGDADHLPIQFGDTALAMRQRPAASGQTGHQHLRRGHPRHQPVEQEFVDAAAGDVDQPCQIRGVVGIGGAKAEAVVSQCGTHGWNPWIGKAAG